MDAKNTLSRPVNTPDIFGIDAAAWLKAQQRSLDELATLKDPHAAYRTLIAELTALAGSSTGLAAFTRRRSNPPQEPTVHDGSRGVRAGGATDVDPSLERRSLMKTVTNIVLVLASALGLAGAASPTRAAEQTSTSHREMYSPINGPQRFFGCVAGYGTTTTAVVLNGGEETEIRMHGDGAADLDLYLLDQNGNIVDSDTSYGPNGYVSVIPRWSGPFLIVVRSRGPYASRVALSVD